MSSKSSAGVQSRLLFLSALDSVYADLVLVMEEMGVVANSAGAFAKYEFPRALNVAEPSDIPDVVASCNIANKSDTTLQPGHKKREVKYSFQQIFTKVVQGISYLPVDQFSRPCPLLDGPFLLSDLHLAPYEFLQCHIAATLPASQASYPD